MRDFYAIIVAAGIGSRMKQSLPKQFIEIDGISILERTLTQFKEAQPSVKLIVVLNEEYIDYWESYCKEHCFFLPQQIVRGGLSRFHSVKNALEKVPDGAIVAIHDGVRPLVSKTLIRDIYLKVDKEKKACIPIVPIVDTVRLFEKDEKDRLIQSDKIIKREDVFAIQTPQCFLSEDIKRAYNQAYDLNFTDDSSVALAAKLDLNYIEGQRWNIKLTKQEDLQLIEYFIKNNSIDSY